MGSISALLNNGDAERHPSSGWAASLRGAREVAAVIQMGVPHSLSGSKEPVPHPHWGGFSTATPISEMGELKLLLTALASQPQLPPAGTC